MKKKGRNKVHKRKVLPIKKRGGVLGSKKMRLLKYTIRRKLAGK